MQENVNIPDSNITTNLTFRQLVLMNMRALTNFPYIEKDFDALTDYELLCLVVKFLNDVIANQNEQNTSITNLYNSFLALQTYVNNTKDTLEDAFNNLDNYVRNYFDNLDVQDEIDHKLDEMAESGQLTDLIAQYLGLAGMIGFDTVADMKLAQNLVNGSKCQTLGFHAINDNGAAKYKIRTKTENETPNECDLISLYDNTLVAELVVDKSVCPEMFGAYGDSNHDGNIGHDDTNAIQAMFDSGFEIFSLRKCIYKITSSIIVHQFYQRNLTLKGEIAYTGTGYAVDFTMDTGRVAECEINFGNIFSHGGCIAFRPHDENSKPVAGMHLSGNIFYAASGQANPNGDCIFVDNNGWFNENFISNINFQHGNYAFRCLYREGSTASIDLGHLVFDECHFEGVSNGVYIDVQDITGHNPSGIVFNDCRMVEAISGSFCNLQIAEGAESPSISCVVVNNDVYSPSKLIGDSLYVIPCGYSFERAYGIRVKGQSDKLIYNGIVLNPPITNLGKAYTNISTDSSNKTIIDLTSEILPIELRGGNDADYYVQINVPQLTFLTMVKVPITAWNDKIYHLSIPTRTQTMYVNLQCAAHEIKTLYIDYYNSVVFIA